MLRFILLFLLVCNILQARTQGLMMGSSTSMTIGENSTVYFGTSASLSGTVENNGEIISSDSLDFQSNLETGAVRFVGTGEQSLAGDSLSIEQLSIENGGLLRLATPWAFIQDGLSLPTGSLLTDTDHRLLLDDEAVVSGDGVVLGPVLAVVGADPVLFPTGIGGAKNHITISSATPGTILRVSCELPDEALLIPAEDMIGIADEVQWSIATVGQQAAGGRVDFDFNRQDVIDGGFASVDFSGVDLQNFGQANTIRANDYEPALVYYSEADSAYRLLESSDVYDTDEISFGKIETNSRLAFSSNPVLLSLAQVPVLSAPTFYVPTAFAPRGTYQENHIFRPYFTGGDVNTVSFSIWDSFNEEVHSFQRSDETIDLADASWNGRLPNDQEAPAGVYFFSVDISTSTGRYTKSGSVLLVK